jgi:hypothetical protein
VAVAGPALADESVHETPHYRVRFSGSTQDAQELTQVLEAAWAPLTEYFGAAPPLDEGERLEVRIFDTAQEWLAVAAEGKTQLTAEDAGCYSPATRVASLYRQPTRYDTRVLLLHECIHQFHFLARRTRGLPGPAWYGEGVAEHLSLHTWDGEELKLGVQPVISLRDYPQRARDELAQALPNWRSRLAGRAPISRPLAWALVRHLESHEDDAVRLGFRRFGVRMDDGCGMPVRALTEEIGRDAPRPADLAAWLQEIRQPWVPATNGWEDIGRGALRGRSPGLAICRLRDPVTRLEATMRIPETGRRSRGGMLLHWSSPDDFTVAVLRAPGRLRVERRKDGRWWPRFAVDVAEPSESGERRMVAERDGDHVTLSLGGETYGPWEFPGTSFGLVVENSDVRFHDLVWKTPPEPAAVTETAVQALDTER